MSDLQPRWELTTELAYKLNKQKNRERRVSLLVGYIVTTISIILLATVVGMVIYFF